jgi:hypothetical protein
LTQLFLAAACFGGFSLASRLLKKAAQPSKRSSRCRGQIDDRQLVNVLRADEFGFEFVVRFRQLDRARKFNFQLSSLNGSHSL